MQKIFIKWFLFIMIITVGVTLIGNFFLQTVFSQKKAELDAAEMIADISTRIADNHKVIEDLMLSLNENYITRANALAEIISSNPSIVDSFDEMDRLAKRLRVDEVHVTDEKGVLRWGNVRDYYGLDFGKTKQTRPFLPALKDKSFELAQEPQPNGIEGKLFQYIGVARQDKTGIVQVGVAPEVLDRALSNNKIDVVIANYNMEKGNTVIAIDKKTGKVAGDTHRAFIGKSYKELGIHEDNFKLKKKSGWVKTNNQKEFAVFGQVGEYLIEVTYEKKLLFADRKSQNIAAAFSSILLGMAIIIAIFILLKKVIINDMEIVNRDLQKITNGDLGVVVRVKSTPEFIHLGTGINQMVDSLKRQMDEIVHQTSILQEQASKLEENNINIMDSLHYARKIQKNLLPSAEAFKNTFSDYSILWEPKDVVGGDIYWIKEFDKGTVLCVCDCTGHGTPGALLTMLIVSILDAVVTEETCESPETVLWELDRRLFYTLNASEGSNSEIDIKDGADLLIAYVKKDGDIILSSVKLRIFICSGHKVEAIKGQKLSIGDGSIRDKEQIKVVTIPYNQKNSFYVATDGLFEQVGGQKQIPYGYSKFKELIKSNYGRSQNEVVNEIWQQFEKYRGEEGRRDDITLIGWNLKI